MNAPVLTHEPEADGLDTLLRRLAREMRVDAAIADDCQDSISWDDLGALSPEMTERLQGLDLLSQHLIEIGRVLDGLAAAGLVGPAPRGLLDDVRLGDLKKRLEGTTRDAAAPAEPELW